MKKILNWWIDGGWTSFGLFVIFLVISIVKYFKGSDLGVNHYLAIGFLVIAIIQLIMKYKKK